MIEFTETEKKIIFEALEEWRKSKGYRYGQIEPLIKKLRKVL